MTQEVNKAIEAVIVERILNQPRSLQRAIGPSEIGTDCIRCLARKLMGIEKIPGEGIADVPWLPFIGTSVHAQLEDFFRDENDRLGKVRWFVETRLPIGRIGDKEITGSCDLFDSETGTVIDHKVVGTTKLKSVPKKGPGNTYRVQAHLYGLGWTNLGYEVENVAVKFYPRNDISLTSSHYWYEKYDETIALAALERANEVLRQATEAKDLTEFLKICSTSGECFSCSEYPPLDEPVAQITDDLFDQPAPYHKR